MVYGVERGVRVDGDVMVIGEERQKMQEDEVETKIG